MQEDYDQSSKSDCSSYSLSPKRLVGFDAKNKDSLSSYICFVCTLLLRYPVQLICGHRLCQSCVNVEVSSIVKCSKCDEVTLRDRIILDRGCQLDMEKLNIICSLCDWSGIFKDYQEHLDKVYLNPFCQFCGKEFNIVDSLTQHLSICEKATLNCVLKSYGCNEQFLRTNIREHFLSQQHQHVLLEFLTEKIQHLTNNKDDESIVPYSTTKSTDRELDESSHVNLQQLFETMDIVISGLNVLNDDTQRLTSESFQYQRSIQSLSEDVFRLNTAIKETHSSINDHINSQQIIEEGLTSLQQQLDDQKNISHNGTLIWKITNIQQKIDRSIIQRITMSIKLKSIVLILFVLELFNAKAVSI
ncbi:unnamed protein product, partial [Rotaria sp. Silwood2]